MARWDRAWHRRLNEHLIRCAELADPLQRSQVRRALGEDPVAFPLIYLRNHLRGRPQRDPQGVERPGKVSFAGCHYEWAQIALGWRDAGDVLAEPAEDRHAIVAPRETGKSTWWYLILPLWAAAYGHKEFVAAYAHATSQSETHLATFRKELENNVLLRADFPDLCKPARRSTGTTLADRAGMYHCANGFTFAAKGIDATSLGMKVGSTRPDLIILDDIEPDEAQYTPDLVRKRLGTVRDAILPMNIYATVVIVGTVQIPGSVIHQFVRVVKGEGDEETEWIEEENFQPHWHRPIVDNDDGTMRSLWPEKWPLEWLIANQGTRSYEKNYDNDPKDGDGSWWRHENIVYGSLPPDQYDRTVMFIDGAVTNKKQSDYTGIAIVSLSVSERRFYVREAIEVKIVGEELRQLAYEKAEEFDVDYVMVESNQGGDLWYTVFHDMPCKITTYTQKERKEVRLRRLLGQYQRLGSPVRHERVLPKYQRRMMAYPHTDHDDVLDAVAAACEHLTWILLKALGKAPSESVVRQYAVTGHTPTVRSPGRARGTVKR
jgi:phage terminase large subunit-like protein